MTQVDCGFTNTPTTTGSALLTQFGPTLFVDIGFDKDYRSGTTPNLGIKKVAALVDTGASESCIDNMLAAKLQLPIIDRRPISGSAGQHETNIYLAQIHVPDLRFTIHGSFAGVNLISGGQPHFALIGRTFLQHFSMSYNGRIGSVILLKA